MLKFESAKKYFLNLLFFGIEIMGDKAQPLTTNRPALFGSGAENACRLQETDRRSRNQRYSCVAGAIKSIHPKRLSGGIQPHFLVTDRSTSSLNP
ncbi:hypothetical protein NLA06_10395 [Desulfomicrobium sp. ZS1]|uniref:hypothetical protein n=1 Tax=Desulfomicrobium sp. ZS1 TaxID=2952228 RepID=UPI0020B22C66|nr:hypothetical protein [Desulfomicrobium sp. ZS1]UTF48986.1 hypothetical protein NLA06_10395 [Desulfomicrobium sp. ZS1]